MYKGQFIPDLLSMQTLFYGPNEMKELWHSIGEAYKKMEIPRQDFNIDKLVALGSWIHEFVHLLQFTTRIQGIDYYRYSQSIASESINCIKELIVQFKKTNNRIILPLLRYAIDNYNSKSNNYVIKKWFEYWFEINRILVVGGWGIRNSQDSLLLNLIKDNYNIQFYPIEKIKNKKGKNVTIKELELTTDFVLEVEALTVEFLFLRMLFPERFEEIVEKLHGNLNQQPDDYLNYVFNIFSNGFAYLIPMLVDFSMQTNSWAEINNVAEFYKYSCAWRFKHALDILDKYAGITPCKISDNQNEIVSFICKKLDVIDPEIQISKSLEILKNRRIPSISNVLQKLLYSNTKVRKENKTWFILPITYFGEIQHLIRNPRVLFNHSGIPFDTDYFISSHGFGPKVLKEGEEIQLLFDCLYRWAGREISTREGPWVCPECVIVKRRLSNDGSFYQCSGDCHFSSYVNSLVGYNLQSVIVDGINQIS